jgi:hypothetical protein
MVNLELVALKFLKAIAQQVQVMALALSAVQMTLEAPIALPVAALAVVLEALEPKASAVKDVDPVTEVIHARWTWRLLADQAVELEVDWQFTTTDARIRLKRLYPLVEN